MKKGTTRAYLVIFFLLLNIPSLLADGDKRALIIAVGDYDKQNTGWNPISSENDVPLIESALKIQGFNPTNITVIVNKQATKKGILDALEKLYNDSKTNDVVVIHYSGHGQQITDDNHDEIDGFDEAMVPIDAHSRYQKGVYEGEKHIRDDEIGAVLARLRKKVGPGGSVMLIMDSCHSGTASRGLAKTRGTQETFNTTEAKSSEGKAEEGLFGLSDGDNKEVSLAPLICFYGASAHELNYETKDTDGKGVGSLSLAFSDAFANANPNQTYAELFDQIKNKMSTSAPRQSPQAEGELGNVILGGKIDGKKPYFNVVKMINDDVAIINAGSLMGVYENSEITFYALGAEILDDNKMAIGTVTFADATSADVSISWTKEKADLKNCKAIISKVNYGAIAVSVQLDVKAAALDEALKSEFLKYPLISLVDADADLLVEENNAFTRGEKLHLITSQEYELFSEPYTEASQTAKLITAKVLAYAQANYLRNVAMENEDLNVTFEFVPITAKQVGRGTWQEDQRLSLKSKMDTSGNVSFEDGDFFKIKVKNDGYEVAYFSLLDFQPDNVVNVLVPGKYEKAADFVVKPGEEKELPRVFRFGKPYGTEVFKLVASKEPIPFQEILLSKGASRGAADESNNPFAQLVQSSFRGETQSRSAETMNVEPGNCNIQSVSFSITAKK